jgi:hypothetical protein
MRGKIEGRGDGVNEGHGDRQGTVGGEGLGYKYWVSIIDRDNM